MKRRRQTAAFGRQGFCRIGAVRQLNLCRSTLFC
jgi:hypothetical protein